MATPGTLAADIAAHMAAHRKELGWTQAAYAAHIRDTTGLPYHTTTIARIEAGTRRFTFDEAVALLAFLGYRVHIEHVG